MHLFIVTIREALALLSEHSVSDYLNTIIQEIFKDMIDFEV